jgi:ubiquinone/menaquinone biosynthesis C-methylase UbiE
MADSDYEYRGLMAEFWDLLRGDTSGWSDRFFFRDVIGRYGQPVLDVGCGTGRLLLDYLASGIDIDGVDNSPEMLAICREKAKTAGLQPNVYQQTMETLALPRRYRTIIVPSSSFQLLLEPAQARAAMNRFYEHLEPGGALAMPFMILLREGEAVEPAPDWGSPREQVRPSDGALIRRYSRTTFDVENQLESTEDRYEILVNGEVVASEEHRRSPATRWYSQEQAVQLYRDAGFENIEMFKEFSWEPAEAADMIFSIVGEKPG